MNIGGGGIKFIRKLLGIYLLADKIDNISMQLTGLAGKIEDIRLNQSFIAAYKLYEKMKQQDILFNTFNKEVFDALLLLTLNFSEANVNYARLTNGRGIFFSQWLQRTSEGVEYLDVKGVKVTSKIPNDYAIGFSVFSVIFQRTLFVHTFFNDNYNKNVVEALDQWMGEGSRRYKDGNFDVTVKSGDIVIDAWAWIGDFSAYAASKGATVYAFEPASTTFALLCDTAALNDDKIHPIRKALSNRIDEVQFLVHQNSACNRIAEMHENRLPCLETVQTTSLDIFVKEKNILKIDFIKVDIQGGERNMLKGSENILRQCAPRLVIATDHRPDDPTALKKIILDANPQYKIVQLRTVLFASVIY
jgi:FkbM family methyltransferase